MLWIKQRCTFRKQTYSLLGQHQCECSNKPSVTLLILWQRATLWPGCMLDSSRGTLVVGLEEFHSSLTVRCQYSHGMNRDWDPTTVWCGRTLVPSLIQQLSAHWLMKYQTSLSAVIGKLRSMLQVNNCKTNRILSFHANIYGCGSFSPSFGMIRD